MKINKIVIWGDDHHNALGLLRMLGGRGFDILLIVKNKEKIATASKYCTRYIEIPSLEDGIRFLIDNYHDKENKAVLLFTADKYSEMANKHLSKLQEVFYVSGPDVEGSLECIDDKYSMGELASKCGFTIPKTTLLSSDIEVDHFPAIIKPCRPAAKDFKTIIVNNQRELKKSIKVLIPGKRYVLQQYVQKKADCLVYGCRTMDDKTIIAGACIRDRWSDDGCGSFGYITPDLPKGVDERKITEFLEAIKFHGLFSVEYALTDNDAYFYEFNLRNDGTSHLFYQGGANIALAYVNSCFGYVTKEPVIVNSKAYLINEFLDKYNVTDKVITKKQYEDDYNRSTIFFYYDPDDIIPYYIQKSQNKKRTIRRMISKTLINKIRLKIKKRVRSGRKIC